MALPITCNANNYTPIVQHIAYFKTVTDIPTLNNSQHYRSLKRRREGGCGGRSRHE